MQRTLVLVFIVALSGDAVADSFRCGSAVIKDGDSQSKLVEKCGEPQSKHIASAEINNYGNRYSSSVVNWVYNRRNKSDMFVSVRDGVIIKIAPD